MSEQSSPSPTTTHEAFQQAMCETLEEAYLKIEHCLNQLDQEQIWWRPEESMNSIANHVLHMCGNLRQWSVVPLTGQTDQRDRQSEFEAQGGWTRDELLRLARQTIDQASAAILAMKEEQATEKFAIQGFDVNGVQAVVHTVAHFVGHTHQTILMTRLIKRKEYRFAWDPTAPRGRVPI